jgi:integrase
MREGDLDWAQGTLTVHRSKGGRSRCLPVEPSVLQALQAYQKRRRQRHPRPPGETFFLNGKGQPLLRAQAEKTFRGVRARLGWQQEPQPRLHDLRHTFRHSTAMHLLQAGVDITVIALLLGHESPATTHHYIELDLAMKERRPSQLKAPTAKLLRFKPTDRLLEFLENLSLLCGVEMF